MLKWKQKYQFRLKISIWRHEALVLKTSPKIKLPKMHMSKTIWLKWKISRSISYVKYFQNKYKYINRYWQKKKCTWSPKEKDNKETNEKKWLSAQPLEEGWTGWVQDINKRRLWTTYGQSLLLSKFTVRRKKLRGLARSSQFTLYNIQRLFTWKKNVPTYYFLVNLQHFTF